MTTISPKLGTEIKGVQLSHLNDAGKDEVALLASQRGVLVFRDQDLIAKGPEYLTKYVSHYGTLHIHPTSGAPQGHPDIHSVLTGDSKEDPFQTRNRLVGFHTDVSYELNPTGVSFLAVTNILKLVEVILFLLITLKLTIVCHLSSKKSYKTCTPFIVVLSKQIMLLSKEV